VTKTEKIAMDLNSITADVRAEVLLAQCMDGGLVQKKFNVQADGFFYRTHVHDLYKIKYNDQNGYQNFLSVHLSRPGLYDALPEGLFFQAGQGSRAVKDAGEMAEECRINKKKETEIRKFFAPFEHEFFLQTLKNETVETNLLQGLRSGWLKEYFIDFWKLPQDIPATAALILVMFLPYVHRIAGDIAATAGVLQKIINEPVKVNLIYCGNTDAAAAYNILGSFTLGSQLTCGKSFVEQYPVVDITIGPLQKTKAYQYVEGGNYFALLQTFYNYFIPANAELSTTVLVQSNAEKLILNQQEDAPLLGISSVI
jgi:hypothetical protein